MVIQQDENQEAYSHVQSTALWLPSSSDRQTSPSRDFVTSLIERQSGTTSQILNNAVLQSLHGPDRSAFEDGHGRAHRCTLFLAVRLQ